MAKQIKRTKQDYLNLLKETVNYYTVEKNERSVNEEGGCFYYKDGKMCAVGRCLINPKDKDKKLSEVGWGDSTVEELMREFNQSIFKKQYRRFDTNFWGLLQELHDSMNAGYWNAFELTRDGNAQVQNIKEWIEANVK